MSQIAEDFCVNIVLLSRCHIVMEYFTDTSTGLMLNTRIHIQGCAKLRLESAFFKMD